MVKTNSVRLLESCKITFDLLSYELDESDLSARALAEKTGLDGDRIFKTLVLQGASGSYFVCVIPGSCDLDLAKTSSLRYIERIRQFIRSPHGSGKNQQSPRPAHTLRLRLEKGFRP
ncbi:MAG: hypothetical protein JXA95_14605 [Spirochaetales bacterium]|nr:hypothetical protein [Spirochaetales bacterium]